MIKYLLILFLAWQCLGRMFETSMKFNHIGKNNGWVYLNKMSFAPGTVWFKVRTQTKGIAYGQAGSVTIEAIPEYLWQHEQHKKCQNNLRQHFLVHKISVAEPSQVISQKSFTIEETTMFYFVLKDCQKSLKAQYENNNLSLNIRLHLLNNGGQIGQEEDHWYIVPVIILAGAWSIFFYASKVKRIDMKRQIHKMIMFVGIASQVSSLTWKTFGYLIYIYTGYDYGFFHLIYLFMHSISQSIVIGLIILISFGWTINFMKIPDDHLYFPLIACLAFFNLVATLLTKLSTGDHDKHHVFDNITGTMIVGYRIVFVLVFIGAIIRTYRKSKAKVQSFIKSFGCFGALYIAALPLIVWIGNSYVSAKDRHEFVFVALETLKCITNIGMILMLNLERSEYRQVSYENRSFVPEESQYF